MEGVRRYICLTHSESCGPISVAQWVRSGIEYCLPCGGPGLESSCGRQSRSFVTLLCFIKSLTAGRLVYLKPWPAAHHIATALYSHKKSISRENTVLPIEKFLSLVLSRNTICYNTSVIHFPLYLSVNRPFYCCLLGDLAFEWQRGWSWPCFGTDVSAFVM